MDLQLKNKVIIVTGGARGIGEGIVRLLAAEGAIPVIVGRDEADNLKLVEELTKRGLQAGHRYTDAHTAHHIPRYRAPLALQRLVEDMAGAQQGHLPAARSSGRHHPGRAAGTEAAGISGDGRGTAPL